MKKANKIAIMILIMVATISCKSRKVATSVSISSTKDQETKSSETKVYESNKTKSLEVETTSSDDSTETIVHIVPSQGETITIQPDGSFTGKASSITTTTKHKSKKKTESKKEVAKDVKKDSTVKLKTNSQHQSSQKIKVKKTEAKPSYSWIIYLVLCIAAVFILYKVYRRFVKR